MFEPKESMGQKMLFAAVQTLVFGILLACLGYWLNVQLETSKHLLTNQTEKLKAMLSPQDPLTQQRRALYLEFRRAIVEVKNTLETYYHLADSPGSDDALWHQLVELEEAMRLRPGGGGGASWRTKEDVAQSIKNLISLRTKDELLLPASFNEEVDSFIKKIIYDLKESEKPHNNNKPFHMYAIRNLHETFKALNARIEDAVGL
jgi:hypothetical protein